MDIRHDLADAQSRAWADIGKPGTWYTGAERVAIAAESRQAHVCPLCTKRREALSPTTVQGAHDHLGKLGSAEIEAVHRIATDSGRLGHGWYRKLMQSGLTDTRYTELVSIVAIVAAVDTFRYGIGLTSWDLPLPQPGEPTRHRPSGARPDIAWMATLAPEDRTADDSDLYRDDPGPRGRPGANVQRALSLVPDSMIHWWDMFEPMYFTSAQMRDFTREPRAITHVQMEMLAARVAALNRCEY